MTCIKGSTLEKSHTSVGNVVSTSVRLQVFSFIRVSTRGRNHISVMCVVRSSAGPRNYSLIRESTQGRNLTHVTYVVRDSAGDQILQFIIEFMVIRPIKIIRMVRENSHKKFYKMMFLKTYVSCEFLYSYLRRKLVSFVYVWLFMPLLARAFSRKNS